MWDAGLRGNGASTHIGSQKRQPGLSVGAREKCDCDIFAGALGVTAPSGSHALDEIVGPQPSPAHFLLSCWGLGKRDGALSSF